MQTRMAAATLELQDRVHASKEGHNGDVVAPAGMTSDKGQRKGERSDRNGATRGRVPAIRTSTINVENWKCKEGDEMNEGDESNGTPVSTEHTPNGPVVSHHPPQLHRLPEASVWIAEAQSSAWQPATNFLEANDVELWTEGFRFTASGYPQSGRLIARFGRDPIMVVAGEITDAVRVRVDEAKGEIVRYCVTCRLVSRLPRSVGMAGNQ